ncbi:MAG: hypothetical protein AB7I41_08255 [Candidatus Sericytochromatia bacterium]
MSQLTCPPELTTSTREALSLTLMEVLEGKQPTIALKKQHQHYVNTLAAAIRSGKKEQAYRSLQELYREAYQDNDIVSAYFKLYDLGIEGNTNFKFVMGAIAAKYIKERPAKLAAIGLEKALVLILLAFTNTPKPIVAYVDIDPVTQKKTSITVPIKEEVIQDFLAPFKGVNNHHLLKRSVIFHREIVFGNPAGELSHTYQLKREQWQKDKTAWEATQNRENNTMIVPDALKEEKKEQEKKQFVKALPNKKADLYAFCETAEQEQAASFALEPENMRKLMFLAEAPKNVFLNKLKDVYTQKLGAKQALQLAERMTEAFQKLLQELKRLAGKNWLQMWQEAHVFTGKQKRDSSSLYLKSQASSDPLDAMLRQNEMMQDKIAGSKLLATQQTQTEDADSFETNIPPELEFILKAFQEPLHFQQVLECALPQNTLEALNDNFLYLLETVFTQYTHCSFPQLKNMVLDLVPPDEKELASQTIALIELACNKMAQFQSQKRKTDFNQALNYLQMQIAEEQEKERLNSLEFRNSPAHQYRKYAT